MYYGICKMREKKMWFSKEPLMGLPHFILTQVLCTNDGSVPAGKGGIKINIPQQIDTKYFQLRVQLLNN